ncbi:MAG TPA: DUF4105 domain-containing protein [Polyangiaceae bacterium]|nr:DUF4105 domain-containing protein [Polyangiaceae bacterium]
MRTVRRGGGARPTGSLPRRLPALCAWVLAAVALLHVVSARAAEPGDSLTVSLLTMGPGEHPFTKFGHSAIWVHDAQTNRDEVYNFGTFAFDSPTLLLDSVQGKLPYWLSVQSMSGTLAAYREQRRSLLSSELELTPGERLNLLSALRDNALPAHRYYRYDYYRDNCATRVRDAMDRVLGGQLRARGTASARMSYRAHTLRLVADDVSLYVALDLAVGRQTDSPITFWDEGFLPERLHDLVANTSVLRDGRALPLVRREQLLLPAELPEPRAAAPNWRPRYWDVGMLFGSLLAWLGVQAPSRAAARAALGVASVLLGVPLGLLGCALAYLTFFSAHSAAAANYNVLLVPPWVLAVSVAGVAAWRKKPWASCVARWATAGAFITTVIALGIRVFMQHPQVNNQELAVALPLWLGAAIAARLSER